MTPVTFFHTHQLVPHSAIILQADGNKYRDTQPDTLQRDLETLIPIWDVSIKSVPSGLREPWVEEVAKEQEVMEDTKKTNLSKLTGLVCPHRGSMRRSVPGGILKLNKEVNTCLHPQFRSNLQLITTC